MLDPELRTILICPVDHAPLRDEPNILVCTVCGRRYPIVEGIPMMVPDEDAVEPEVG